MNGFLFDLRLWKALQRQNIKNISGETVVMKTLRNHIILLMESAISTTKFFPQSLLPLDFDITTFVSVYTEYNLLIKSLKNSANSSCWLMQLYRRAFSCNRDTIFSFKGTYRNRKRVTCKRTKSSLFEEIRSQKVIAHIHSFMLYSCSFLMNGIETFAYL